LRLVVDTDGASDWLGLMAAIRCRHYSVDDSALLDYGAEEMTPLDTAAVAALTGASGSGSNTSCTVRARSLGLPGERLARLVRWMT
jgi:hypothetical protein